MTGWQPSQYDPELHQQRAQSGRQDQQYPVQPYAQQRAPQPQAAAHAPRKTGLTAAEMFWYVVGNIAFGAMYFAKIPSKKALTDFGLAEMTGAESFWYVLMCIAFGAGYFAKIPTAKAISELEQFRATTHQQLEYRR
jgi:hypothetical protein